MSRRRAWAGKIKVREGSCAPVCSAPGCWEDRAHGSDRCAEHDRCPMCGEGGGGDVSPCEAADCDGRPETRAVHCGKCGGAWSALDASH